MKQYGMPYMGSKSKIADDIVAFLPSDDRFYPLWQKEKAQLFNGKGCSKKNLEIIYSNHPCPPCGTVQMMLFPEAAQ